MATVEQPSTRRVGHLLVDVALLGLAAALIAIVLSVPGPEICPAAMPPSPECDLAARDRTAALTVTVIGLLSLFGWIVNHTMRGARRPVALVALVVAIAVAGLVGADALQTDLRVIDPGTSLG